MTIQDIDWWAIAPALTLVGAGLLALLTDTFLPRAGRAFAFAVTLGGVIVAAWLALLLIDDGRAAFCLPAGLEQPVDCSWVVDNVTVAWWLIILVATALVLLLTWPSMESGDIPTGEFCFLLLSSATGALGVAASLDLITLLVSMETVSLPAFALVALRRGRLGAEASLKFFIASVVATAFTLLGISMVYGATGSVAAGSVAVSAATDAAVEPVIAVAMMLTIVGLAFKVAVVPFQVWVPDTYVGAPVPVAAYLSVVSKIAGLAGLVMVLTRMFPSYVDTWSVVMAIAAALTMTVGNLAALRQQHAVRLLAWSSVAQAGYLLVPLAAGGNDVNVGQMQAYALMYGVVNLSAFAVVSLLASRGATTISDFRGLVRRSPLLGMALVFALLCLAGLPPGVVGLVAKVVIFQGAIDGDLTWLAVVLAINVAIGLVYYLRFIVACVSPTPQHAAGPPTPATVQVVVVATLVAAVALSIFPAPIFAVLP